MEQTFGSFLRAKRKQRKVRMREIANTTGLSLPYLCDIEHDRRSPPDKKVLFYIGEYLKMTPEEMETFCELAAGTKKYPIAPDITEYLIRHKTARDTLRAIMRMNADDAVWQDIRKFLDEV